MDDAVLSSAELTRLWRQHSAALVLLARHRLGSAAESLADDCVQEAFVRLASHDPIPDDPPAWLVRVVRNSAIDALRSQSRRHRRETTVFRDRHAWLIPGHVPVTTETTVDISAEEIHQALLTLDELTRDIVIACLWNQLTFRQIAAAFDLPAATAHRRYEAGLASLRNILLKGVNCE